MPNYYGKNEENYILSRIDYWNMRLARYRSRFHGNEGARADFIRQDKQLRQGYKNRYMGYI